MDVDELVAAIANLGDPAVRERTRKALVAELTPLRVRVKALEEAIGMLARMEPSQPRDWDR